MSPATAHQLLAARPPCQRFAHIEPPAVVGHPPLVADDPDADRIVGVLTHERDDAYGRRRELIEAGAPWR